MRSGAFQVERITVDIDVTVSEHVAVIFKDNPRVNVTIDPKRKRSSPLIENRLSLFYRHGIRVMENN